MEEIVLLIAAWLGISPVTLIVMLPASVAVANVVTRVIPDDATGVLRLVRLATKFIGLYAANRVTSGVTVNDVAKTFADGVRSAQAAKDKLDALGVKQANEVLNQRGLRDASGRFVSRTDGSVSHKVGLTLGLLGLIIFLAGCTTTKDWLANPCKYADKAQRVIDVAQQVVNQCPSHWAQ